MARHFEKANKEYYEIPVAVITGHPTTFSAWFYVLDTVNPHVLICVADYAAGGAGLFYYLGARGDIVGNPVVAQAYAKDARTTTGFTANTWHHACAVFASATERHVYIDGGSKGSDLTLFNPSGFSRTAIGRIPRSDDPGGYVDGYLAEPTIWDGAALTDDEVAALASGVHSRHIRPDSVKALWPLWGDNSPEIDLTGNGYEMIPTGTISKADHAPVQPFTMPSIPNVLDIGPPPPSIFPENYDVIVEDPGLIVVADGSTYNVVVDNSTMDVEVPT